MPHDIVYQWLVPSGKRVVVSSGRAFDRHGPLYYDYMKNYDASSDLLSVILRYLFVIADATVRDKYSYRNH